MTAASVAARDWPAGEPLAAAFLPVLLFLFAPRRLPPLVSAEA